ILRRRQFNNLTKNSSSSAIQQFDEEFFIVSKNSSFITTYGCQNVASKDRKGDGKAGRRSSF
ncbi:14121_t:CDS:2, partial [Rhizophagus irregularis]